MADSYRLKRHNLMKLWLDRKVWLIFLTVALIFHPAFAKKAKTPTPTPAPAPAHNLAAMNKALRFWVYEKSTDVVSDVSGIFDAKAQKITLKCELKNETKKEIHGVRGTLRFATFFGETIADITVESTTAIAPGEKIGVNWDVPTDRLSPEAFDKLKKADLNQVKQIWYPRMVVFTDGTVLK